MTRIRLGSRAIAAALLSTAAGLAQQEAQPASLPAGGPPNPYRLAPFHADFPIALEYPNQYGRDYDRTRRQVIEQLVANLQGNVRREAWQMAMEFFWRAPDDAVEPLIEAMDRSFGQPALQDVVRNCVEAMGKMANERFDAALQRALEHKHAQVRQAAFAALGRSGTLQTLEKLERLFPQMDGRSRGAWLAGVSARLVDKRVAILKRLMMADFHSAVRDQVLEVTLKLPVNEAAEILRGRWDEAIGEFKAVIAGVLHAAGDGAGTAWLQEALEGQDLPRLQLALKHVGRGDLGVLRADVLKHSTNLRSDVRLQLATTLQFIEGDDVADVYEVMTSPDEALEIKEIALRELTRRGRPAAVGLLLDEVATATGTRLQLLLHLLAASNDERAVPVLVERFRRAPAGEGRPFLQALAQNHSAAAAKALLELFCGPTIAVASGAQQVYTTTNYLPTLLLNARGAEAQVLATFTALPHEDYLRRAHLMTTLSGIAGDRTDPALQAQCQAPLREVLFDREAAPQLRVLALNLLTPRALTVEDALRLKNQRFDEQPGMRALFADFLIDYF
ncbi:MAG: HEAT repeat domain-containing protein [Planctomycetes bacterium]|nr:HEAT repeat domain-containing protein [Planctomycetota bacterium]MCB9887218.1 HEAT repeat domain-containing protein [Planctomycetota bacterium]